MSNHTPLTGLRTALHRYQNAVAADERDVIGDPRTRDKILAGRRLEHAHRLRSEGLAAVEDAQKQQLPRLATDRAADLAAAKRKLRSGAGRPALVTEGITDPGQLALLREQRQTQDRLDALLSETRRGNLMAEFQRLGTEALADRVGRFAEAARGDTWPYKAWARERQVLETILRDRVGQGDERAKFALAAFEDVEAPLLRRMVPAADAEDLNEVLWKSQDLLRGIHGETPDLRPVVDFLGFVDRVMNRTETATPAKAWYPSPAEEAEE